MFLKVVSIFQHYLKLENVQTVFRGGDVSATRPLLKDEGTKKFRGGPTVGPRPNVSPSL